MAGKSPHRIRHPVSAEPGWLAGNLHHLAMQASCPSHESRRSAARVTPGQKPPVQALSFLHFSQPVPARRWSLSAQHRKPMPRLALAMHGGKFSVSSCAFPAPQRHAGRMMFAGPCARVKVDQEWQRWIFQMRRQLELKHSNWQAALFYPSPMRDGRLQRSAPESAAEISRTAACHPPPRHAADDRTPSDKAG